MCVCVCAPKERPDSGISSLYISYCVNLRGGRVKVSLVWGGGGGGGGAGNPKALNKSLHIQVHCV